MVANTWEISSPAFSSIAELLESMEVFIGTLQLKAHGIADASLADSAGNMLNAAKTAQKTLKQYLFQLSHLPGRKKSTAPEVIKTFQSLTSAWKAIPAPQRFNFMAADTIETYEESITGLLKNPSALNAAIKDLHFSVLEIAEDEIK